MRFSTLTFALFLPLVVSLYWSLSRRTAQNLLLIIASYGFYAWWDVRFTALMAASTLVDYAAGLGIERARTSAGRRAWLVASLGFNLGLLGFFKYFNFFADNLAAALGSVGWQTDHVTLELVLPIGISFYTFQTMSYTIDVYRGRLSATRSLLDYSAFVCFFPQLVAGPIERGARLLPQFQGERRFDHGAAVDGCRQLLWGLFKKMVIADQLALIVDPIFASPAHWTGPQLIVATLGFTFQVYCDFSAYSDIAIGTARLFGFDLMRNFALPFFSQDMAEFWRRWHVSLSTWFRDYVYIPLGGKRTSKSRRALNIMVTFVLAGLWHGASWTYVFWGAINGIGILPVIFWGGREALTAMDAPGGDRPIPSLRTLLRIASTFLLFAFSLVFFRSSSMADAWLILGRMASDVLQPSAYAFRGLNMGAALATAAVTVPLLVTAEWLSRRHPHPLHLLDRAPRPWRWAGYTVICWATLYLMPGKMSPFIYFQF